jgi:peptidoglycan/xylan/chitin deacetylase (PgdA/CDA1 family)
MDKKIAHGLMFHRFHKSGSEPDGQGSLTEKDLEKIINSKGRKRILNADEWISRLNTNNLNTDDLCMTFDDGLKSQYEIAVPVLNKYSIKAFFFIYSSVFFDNNLNKNEIYNKFAITKFKSFDKFVDFFFKQNSNLEKSFSHNDFKIYTEDMKSKFPFYSINDLKFRFIRNNILTRIEFENVMDELMFVKDININNFSSKIWMDNKDIQDLSANNHCIGLHSFSHPFNISNLDLIDQKNEYTKNYNHIKETVGVRPISMSHPLNSYSCKTIDILKNLGVKCGFCSNINTKQIYDTNKINTFEIPREDGVNLILR